MELSFVLVRFHDKTVHCDIVTVFECRHLAVWPPKKTFLSNILAVRNCCDAYSFYFPASTSDLLMQTISLPLGSLLAVVLGHIILYENVGWQALAVRQNSAARCLSLQLFWKSAWIFFFFYVPYIKALWLEVAKSIYDTRADCFLKQQEKSEWEMIVWKS